MINQADLPFHVSAGASNLGIVKTTEGSFHVYRTGAFHELITGWKFMIASERLASVLGALGDPHLTLTPATIVGVPEGVSISKYCELSISSELDPRNLANVDIKGKKVWQFTGEHLFVSPEARLYLKNNGFAELRFEPGFYHFAGKM